MRTLTVRRATRALTRTLWVGHEGHEVHPPPFLLLKITARPLLFTVHPTDGKRAWLPRPSRVKRPRLLHSQARPVRNDFCLLRRHRTQRRHATTPAQPSPLARPPAPSPPRVLPRTHPHKLISVRSERGVVVPAGRDNLTDARRRLAHHRPLAVREGVEVLTPPGEVWYGGRRESQGREEVR